MCDLLTETDFDLSLKRIIIKASESYKNRNYKENFKKVWLKSPAHLKSLIVDELDKKWVLKSLFLVKDKENTKLLLKDATLAMKRILFTRKKHVIFCNNLY